MERRVRRLAAVGMLMLGTGILAAGEIMTSFSDATLMVARINVEKVKQVPPVQQVLAGQISNLASFLGQIKQWTGVDLLTVKTFWLGVEKKDCAVIVLEGVFNVGEVEGAMENIPNAKPLEYENVPLAVLLPDDKHPGRQNLAALLNATTLAIGEPEVAGKFVTNYAGVKPEATAALSAAAQAKLGVLRGSTALLHTVVLGVTPELAKKQPFLAFLDAAELRGDLDADLALKLTVSVTKPEMVEPLQKLADGFFGFARQMDLWSKSQPLRKDEMIKQNLLANAAAAVENGRVVVRSRISQAVLNDLLANTLNAVPAPQKQP